MVGTYCDGVRSDGGRWTADQMRRDLALHMEQHANEARDTMKGMQKCLMGAGVSLGLEVLFWLIEYGT